MSHRATLERLFEEVWTEANYQVTEVLVHEGFTMHDRSVPEGLSGPERYASLARETHAAFDDLVFSIDGMLEDGDRLAVRWTMTGTHTGQLYGIDPTGVDVEYGAIEIDRFADGKLIETWTKGDELGLLRQLGAIAIG